MVEFFEWCQSFVQSIADTISSLFQLLKSLLDAVFDLIEMLPSVVTMVTSSIGFLPDMVMLFAGLSITVSIIYLIVGRNNN